jgi:hypothetical protein
MALFEYPGRELLVDFECTFSNDLDRGSMRMMGEHATIYIDRGRWELTAQMQKVEPPVVTGKEIASEGPRGDGDYAGYNAAALHFLDWLDAMREKRDPADPVAAGVQAAAVCHHGNIALRERRVVEIG